ncbi:hypothetical protein BDZ89DRAFT_1075320 [Hymenopellis radicata]|nr:hypothetical protein BDZ89DRAFT_1075320 [Hymenopellis radicata]
MLLPPHHRHRHGFIIVTVYRPTFPGAPNDEQDSVICCHLTDLGHNLLGLLGLLSL